MRQRVHLITLGVEDLDRAAAFYDALGWTRAADCPPGLVAYDLYGATLGLYPREKLAEDVGRALPRGSGAVTLACNVREAEEVATTLAAAAAAGAHVLRQAGPVFWGGTVGYFEDPDGVVWEVAHNPHSPLGPEDQFRWSGWQENAA